MATETQVELEPVKASPPKPPGWQTNLQERETIEATRDRGRGLVFGVIIGLVFFAHYQSYESTDDAFIGRA